MTTELQVQNAPMSVNEMMAQINLIQEIMKKAMKKDEHYGVIPGTKKPTLYKAGAEKLVLTFRFVTEFRIDKSEMERGNREYNVCCFLKDRSGVLLGEGHGSCSTMETKYRWRKGEGTNTGKEVPKSYWGKKNINMIGGKGFFPKKTESGWFIFEGGDKVENDNPANEFNTVLKMAKKRALVDAVLTVTAASDMFEQDVEDMHPDQIHQRDGVQKDIPEENQNHEESWGGQESQPTDPKEWGDVVIPVGKKFKGRKLGEVPKGAVELIYVEWFKTLPEETLLNPQEKFFASALQQAVIDLKIEGPSTEEKK